MCHEKCISFNKQFGSRFKELMRMTYTETLTFFFVNHRNYYTLLNKVEIRGNMRLR